MAQCVRASGRVLDTGERGLAKAAREGDKHTCDFEPPRPAPKHSPGGPITPVPKRGVQHNGRNAACITDPALCTGSQSMIISGSTTVRFGGLAAARVDDDTLHSGGKITEGSDTVDLGGSSVYLSSSELDPIREELAKLDAEAVKRATNKKGEVDVAKIKLNNAKINVLRGKLREVYLTKEGEEYPPPGSGIRVKGDKKYRDKVITHLKRLERTKTMAPVFEKMRNRFTGGAGKDWDQTKGGDWDDAMTIQNMPESNHERNNPYVEAAGISANAGDPTKGTGTNVYFDPDGYGPNARPPSSGPPPISPVSMLGHEMIHAHHNGQGCHSGDATARDEYGLQIAKEEAKTIGVHPYEKDLPNENALRAELGMRPRKSHLWPETSREAARVLDQTNLEGPPGDLTDKEKEEWRAIEQKLKNDNDLTKQIDAAHEDQARADEEYANGGELRMVDIPKWKPKASQRDFDRLAALKRKAEENQRKAEEARKREEEKARKKAEEEEKKRAAAAGAPAQ